MFVVFAERAIGILFPQRSKSNIVLIHPPTLCVCAARGDGERTFENICACQCITFSSIFAIFRLWSRSLSLYFVCLQMQARLCWLMLRSILLLWKNVWSMHFAVISTLLPTYRPACPSLPACRLA